MSEDRLLTAAEVAELLTVPERWGREHTRFGLIPHVPLGRYVRYRRAAVIGWINADRNCRTHTRRSGRPQ